MKCKEIKQNNKIAHKFIEYINARHPFWPQEKILDGPSKWLIVRHVTALSKSDRGSRYMECHDCLQ